MFGKKKITNLFILIDYLFLRPSGTEDIVRIYAEAATQVEADKLADEIRKVVEELTQ